MAAAPGAWGAGSMTGGTLYEATGIAKSYGHVQAVSSASLGVARGEIVALLGDNGAGKSTLIKVLSGAEVPDAGELVLEGRHVSFSNPLAARNAGIETIYQDLAVADNLDVTANLFLGREQPRRRIAGRLGFIDHRAMRTQARQVLERFRVRGIPVDEKLSRLSGGQRQIVAVCRAAHWGSKVVILDEPTASLGVREARNVLDFLVDLRADGIAVLWVSHNVEQVFSIADRAVVMYRGQSIADVRISEHSMQDVVRIIVGAGSEAAEADSKTV